MVAQAINFNEIRERKLMGEEYTVDNFTKFSNAFLDEIVCQIESVSELKVLMGIYRYTVGFQKRADLISYSQLQKFSGLTPSSVSDGLKLALAHGLIERQPSGQRWSYSLKPLAPGYRLPELTTSPRLVEPLAPGECFDEKPLAPGYTPKKGFKENIKKDKTTPKGVGGETPSTSTTYEFCVTEIYSPANQENQPEPETEPEQEPTAMPTSRQEAQQSQYTYPATMPPATPQKVKGDSAPAAGEAGDETRDAGKEKKAKAKAKPHDPNLDNPAVIAYQNKFKLTPDEGQRDLIVTQITDLGEWDAALDYWKDNKYRPLSVGKLVDCYCKGGYKNELPRRNDRGASMGSAGSRGKVAAHPAAPNPKYWDRPPEEIEREWAAFRLD